MNAADLIVGILKQEGVEYLPALLEFITSEEKRFARNLPAGI